MKLERFFEKFELFADAPNAVAKVRELVLLLAMQGKLSEAKVCDVPVSDLLNDIEDEKARLGIKSSTIRLREDSENLEDEMSDAIPERWTWVRFGDIARHNAGKTLDKGRNSGVPRDYITTSNLYWGFFRLEDVRQMPIQDDELERCTAEKGDLLICEGGEAGRAAVWPHDYDISFQNHVHRARFYGGINPYFVQRFFEKLKATDEIDKFRKGVGISNMSGKALASIVLPLPPLAEQKRIVAKVDELMALCDQLEAQQQERDTRHASLACASLSRFAEAPTPANLDFLFHQSYTIPPADLRKSILALAVQGKLVPQNPSDERAEELAAPSTKKSALSKGGRDAPFVLPSTWRWMLLGQVSELINGDRSKNYPNKAEYVREGVAWINTGHIEPDGTLATDSMHYITRKKFDSLRSGKVRTGDLVYCLRGATLGKTAVITQFNEGAVASSLVIVRLSPTVDPRYAYRVLTSPLGREQIFQFDNGSAQPNLSANNVKKYWIPIPPLAEQLRIVAKVDQLMALVDQLESQLAAAKAKGAALLEAVIHELLNPSAEVIDLASYRAAIGCYTISKMSQQPYFGRTAAMKTLYLAEAHVGLNLGFQPEREAAGPLDPWLYRFEDEGKQKAWFKAVENTSNGKMKVEYQPGKMLAAQAAQAESQLAQKQRKEFDRLLDLLSGKKTEEVEIIATLFAAWNDFLIDGHAPSDDEIVTEVRENWHVKKERFTPTLLRQWLGWLRQNNLVPQGRLPHTVHQSKLSLN